MAFFWTIYVFGSCFRTLAVILVSALCVQSHLSFRVRMPVFGLVVAQGSHTQGEISAHSRLALWQLYLEQLRSARPLLHIHLQALVQEVLEHWGQLVLLLDLRLPVCGNQIQRLQGTHRKTVRLKYCRQPKLLPGFTLCPAVRHKDCRYKHTLSNKGLQIHSYTEKQSV